MQKNNIIDYKNPSKNFVTDVLSDFLRESAQQMLQLAIEEEVQTYDFYSILIFLLVQALLI